MTATAPDPFAHDLGPLLGSAGSAWYFTPKTLAAGKSVGLDGLRFYFLGRGGVLGNVGWRVVSSAFGYFSPALVEKMWTTGVQRCDPAVAVGAHLGACADFARQRLEGIGGLQDFCAAAEAVVAAATGDLGGLTLFAGYAAQPLPGDGAARALQLSAVLRELRGSAHLSAVVGCGLPTAVAHAIRRPADMELFGWRPGEVPEPTDDDRSRLAAADAVTDLIVGRYCSALDGAGRDALLAGARALAAATGAKGGGGRTT